MAHIRIVCISDTHSYHKQLILPDGDILIHSGDLTLKGKMYEIEAFSYWLASLKNYEYKIVIAGNHDFAFQDKADEAQEALRGSKSIYLEDSFVIVKGLKIYGSPWQPWFHDWAFNLQRGYDIAQKWAKIPDDTDILVTHGPPFGHGDLTLAGHYVGCEDLLARIKIIKPKLNVFGHIHEAYGMSCDGDTVFINAAVCNRLYQVANAPVVYDMEI